MTLTNAPITRHRDELMPDTEPSNAAAVAELMTASWLVLRQGAIERVPSLDDQQVNVWRVKVWDQGRPPFLVQWFKDPVPAHAFLERLIGDAVRAGGEDLGV